jgi:hypothetical protein
MLRSTAAFEEAVGELQSLVKAPKQRKSMRAVTDEALVKLQDCLDDRAAAAQHMIPTLAVDVVSEQQQQQQQEEGGDNDNGDDDGMDSSIDSSSSGGGAGGSGASGASGGSGGRSGCGGVRSSPYFSPAPPMNMAAAAEAVALAKVWDSEEVLANAKAAVHLAVGNELKKIPTELNRALALKAKVRESSKQKDVECVCVFFVA